MPLPVLFAGSPEVALPALEALRSAGHAITGVVTQPDRPKGRHGTATPCPVAAAARGRGLRVLTPEDLRAPAALAAATAGEPAVGVVVAYGRLLPRAWLEALPHGWVNLHFSLLPRWRGASPVAAAILAGDGETGVSVMRVVKRLDAGPVLAQARTPIGPDETTGELETRLAALGAPLLVHVLADLAAGRAREVAQDEAAATVAPLRTKAEGRVDWRRPAAEVLRHVRAMTPWPGAQATYRSFARKDPVPVTLVRVRPGDLVAIEGPGQVLDAETGTVATAAGAVRIERLVPAGKREIAWADFRNGYRVTHDDWLA